jgi:hypothetical protein
MHQTTPSSPGFTVLGKIVSFLLIAGLIGAGPVDLHEEEVATRAGRARRRRVGRAGRRIGRRQRVRAWREWAAAGGAAAGEVVKLEETQTQVPQLDAPGTYQPQGDVIDVELSKYAGYAGLIAANGGLEPNPNSCSPRSTGSSCASS